jgi:hypothetical protein
VSQVSLASERDVVAARLVKGRLERTTLGQVAADICIAFKPGVYAATEAGLAFMSMWETPEQQPLPCSCGQQPQHCWHGMTGGG